MSELKSYPVWDKTTRWFHWINAVCFTLMLVIGTVIMNANALGASDDGKVLLKTIHVMVGYVLALNLIWRLIWAFIGSRYARWSAILPFGRGYPASLRSYISALFSGAGQNYIGHNPAGRIGVTILLALLTVQVITGLVLAGTDIFYPPLGDWIAEWIAAPGIDPSTVVPYAPDFYDPGAYEAMRAFRAPFIEVHETNFFILATVAFIHIVSVVITEIREGGGLISAMITGRKMIRGRPVDLEDPEDHG